MTNSDFWQAIRDAESTFRNADITASKMADLILGRLRKVDAGTLAKFKRELKSFNAATRKWKE